MKTCPECGIELMDEYQFCPEDGASLAASSSEIRSDVTASAKPITVSAIVLYCPACAAEYPLTFSECPVHHTALVKHGISSLPEPRKIPQKIPQQHEKTENVMAEAPLGVRRLRPVPTEPEPAQQRRPAIEDYEQSLESLARPTRAKNKIRFDERPEPVSSSNDENPQYRQAAVVIAVMLALLALVGIYLVITNISRKPAQTASKTGRSVNQTEQPTITVQTPQAAIDYQEPAPVNPSQSADRSADEAQASDIVDDAQAKPRHNAEPVSSQPSRDVDARALPSSHEQFAVQSPRSAQPGAVAPVAVRQPAVSELALPRGASGLVDARLTSVRASRTAGGYRYDLTFHMADQAGHATQWERLAITTRAASGTSRQQLIPFYHRLGADGTLSFTVSVEMPGRTPADWHGRIVCTSIGSDSSGRTYRSSFGANVSPN